MIHSSFIVSEAELMSKQGFELCHYGDKTLCLTAASQQMATNILLQAALIKFIFVGTL